MKKMSFYEILINISFEKDLILPQTYEYIGKLIAKSIFNENSLIKELHYQKGYKPYVFGSLPKGKIYKKGKKYLLPIRTIKEEIINNIINYKDEFGSVEVVSKKELNLEKITPKLIININPTILVKNDKKYFVPEENISTAIKLLNDNANKKMKYFFGIEEEIDFIDAIRIINKYPIAIKYKKIKFLGNKFLIVPKQDKLSQFYVKALMGLGLGDKNAVVGGGFFNIGV